jgi:hypothetical protein
MNIDEDMPAWHYESTGIFSVKSAYKIALTFRDRHSLKVATMAQEMTQKIFGI